MARRPVVRENQHHQEWGLKDRPCEAGSRAGDSTALVVQCPTEFCCCATFPSPGREAQATFLTQPPPLTPCIRWNTGYKSLFLCFCLFHTSARLPSLSLGSEISLFYFKILDPEKELRPDFRDVASGIPNVSPSLPSLGSMSPTGTGKVDQPHCPQNDPKSGPETRPIEGPPTDPRYNSCTVL